MRLPRGNRVELVEPHRRRDRLPEPIDIGLSEHARRPTAGRIRDRRPVAAAPRQRQARLGDLAHPRAPQARTVDALEEPGLGVADDREQCPTAIAEIVQPVHQPRRRPVEAVVRRALGLGTTEVLVAVVHIDIARPGRYPSAATTRASGACWTRQFTKSCCPAAGSPRPAPRGAHRPPTSRRASSPGKGTRPLSTLRRMGRLALAVVAVGLLLFVAGCGGKTTYTTRPVEDLPHSARGPRRRPARLRRRTPQRAAPSSRTSATTSSPSPSANNLKSGTDIERAYTRFAGANIRSGLTDVLRRYNNAVTLWHKHPSDSDLALVVGCLR